MVELTIDPDHGVYANVQLTVDTTNTDDIDVSTGDFEAAVADEWGAVETETVFITSAPTSVPSLIPSVAPTTLLPTTQPSITGLVVTIDVILFP